jgi:Ca2+-binding RTX toxin-like protein
VLKGGEERDILIGGDGADVFKFHRLSDSGDKVADFSAADGDVIDLSRLDADGTRRGDQDFVFAEALSGEAGQAVLAYDAGRDRTLLRLDVDGDGAADFVLKFAGEVSADTGWVL